jgi:adenosylmethionine-8-amino-7-oxononanoate aminotransferase
MDLPHVEDVRVMGAIGVVEFKNATWEMMFALRKTFTESGCWLRPFGNIIYLMPALTITQEDLDRLVEVIREKVSSF